MSDLQRLQGTWQIASLQTEGMNLPEAALSGSRITIKGNLFTTESMGAVYEGNFVVDEKKSPKTLDLTFSAGPEKGNTALCIYELKGDEWRLCLGVTSKTRPTEFAAKAGSGHAYEVLKRYTGEKPAATPALTDALPATKRTNVKASPEVLKELQRLGGEWLMVSGESAGQALPANFVKSGKRVAKDDEITVSFGGQVMLKAQFQIDPSKSPRMIDYLITDGPFKGLHQYGIYELDGDNLKVCFAAPGKERPQELKTKSGDGCTLTVWKQAK